VCILHPSVNDHPYSTKPRAFEGIKDRLEPLSECSSAEEEGDITTVCNLADDLRDVIAEYQVSNDVVHAEWLTHDEVYSWRSRTQYLS
jgi:hypothetical protein